MTTALSIVQGSFGRISLLDMDTPLVSHAHSQCHVIFKASGADSAYYVSEERLPVTEKTAILVNAWEPHYYFSEPDFPRTVYLVLYIEPKWLAPLYKPFQMSGHPQFFPQPCVSITPRIRAMVDNLIGDLMSIIAPTRESLENILFELMLAISEQFSSWRDLDPLAPEAWLHNDARIRRAIAHIESNLDRPLDADTLASAALLSRAQFFARFRRATGMTPHVFVNTRRTEAASQLLARTDNKSSIGAIGEQIGFNDPGHFTRFIRGQLGVTPSEFRRVVQLYTAD